MKRYSNEPVKTYSGKENILVPLDEKGAKTSIEFRRIVLAVVHNGRYQELSDSRSAMRICQALEDAEGQQYFEIEEADYEWLVKLAEAACPRIFRANGGIVYDKIKDGFIKDKKPGE